MTGQMYEGNGTPIHPSGLNIIQNPDGSYQFEWDSKDERWSWLNGLTDEQVKIIMEEALQEGLNDDQVSESLGHDE